MRDDLDILGFLLVPFALLVLVLGLALWAGQDFANRCERAGGVNIDYEVCIPKDTHVLMTN